MSYLGCYILIGLLLVIVKSPIRKLVDAEIAKTKIHIAIFDEDVPAVKIVLLRIALSAVLIIVYPFMLFSEIQKKKAKKKVLEEYVIPLESHQSWLQDQMTIEEAEAENMVEIDGQKVPFGHTNLIWLKLMAKMQDGDKLYEFRSSDDSWEYLAGRQGIALVRDGEIIADIVTLMN